MKQASTEIPTDKIDPNPFQPRKSFPEREQRELSESIKNNGLIQPIILRQIKERYQILAGERRYRAFVSLGIPTIPAVVKVLNDEEMKTLSIIENIQREDVAPIELAKSYKDLISTSSYTQEDLATKLGKERSTISNSIRLLDLPLSIQEDINNKVISAGHGRAMLPLKDINMIRTLKNQIVKTKLSVRDTEKKVRGLLNPKKEKSPVSTLKKDVNIVALEKQLMERLNTKVEIWGDKSGSIQINFNDVTDFNRVFNAIMEVDRDLDE
jgi:ParB family transcriptional regulator, chromosome partitioning protein